MEKGRVRENETAFGDMGVGRSRAMVDDGNATAWTRLGKGKRTMEKWGHRGDHRLYAGKGSAEG
jgi:hypothetical protein